MSTHRFAGVYPPVVTPLTADRTLDVPSFERLIDRLIGHGVDGLFVLGSTGGVAFATDAQRRQILREAIRITAGRVPVMAGVIDTQTARVMEHVRDAEDAGADAVVVTAPFYAITPEPAVRRHFEIVAERSALPVFAYDIPVCVHTKLSPELLIELGTQGVLAGVKDSSGDDVSFRRLALLNRAAGEPLTLLTGHEFVVDEAYLAGGHGSVPGLANVDPEGFVALHRACLAGDWEAARQIQDRLARLMEICHQPTSTAGWGAGVGAFRAALVLLGVISTLQAPEPFEALSADDVASVGAVLREWGPGSCP